MNEQLLNDCKAMARIYDEYTKLEQEILSDPVLNGLWEKHIISLFLTHIGRSKDSSPAYINQRHYDFIVQNPPCKAVVLSPDPEYDPNARDVQLLFKDSSQIVVRGYVTRHRQVTVSGASFGVAQEIVTPSWDVEYDNDIEMALDGFVYAIPSLVEFAVQIGQGVISVPGFGSEQVSLAA